MKRQNLFVIIRNDNKTKAVLKDWIVGLIGFCGSIQRTLTEEIEHTIIDTPGKMYSEEVVFRK